MPPLGYDRSQGLLSQGEVSPRAHTAFWRGSTMDADRQYDIPAACIIDAGSFDKAGQLGGWLLSRKTRSPAGFAIRR